jgi:hypothetical protein
MKFQTTHPAIKALPIQLPATRQPVVLITLRNRAISPVAQLFINFARELAKSIETRPRG